VLSDRERETLEEIQRRLLLEDPGFAQSFSTRGRRLRRSRGLSRRVYTILLVFSAAFAVLGVVVGSPGSALVLAAVAAVIWEARRRHGTGPSGGDDAPAAPGSR